ncbi:ABC transporter permease [Croceitalea vernalis]|uniref:ABC transporter permease n=1 Tax=Croceitalea vernalis TaxID=3075599 RepID=A0ABU3BD61_9FLAO|nr:ABC transporter permease [Croceitalea sp. P007]MDT0620408.1 ABC transporter permease [Croceitalea sp. P007]
MFKNYLKIAWRNLLKNTGYSIINVGGLAIGLASFLLITIFISNELSFDKYHEKKDNIYRVIHHSNEDSPSDAWVWGNAPVGPALKSDFPEIIEKVQFSGISDILLEYNNRKFQESECFYMDPTAFDVFSWELINGNPNTALKAPYSIVLTETTARKYFGDENPIGKTIEGIGGRANDGGYTVTGVLKDIPKNSHFNFDVLMSMSSFYQTRPEIFDSWGYVDFYTYLLVSDNFDQAAFESKISGFLDKHIETEEREEYFYNFSLESLNNIYLHSTADRQPGETGSLSNIYIFGLIGLFILIIASINFMNLATARSMERAKEVGVRKVIGAERKGLIYQFLGESLILVLVASVIGLVLAFIGLPWLGKLTDKVFEFNSVITTTSILLYFGVTILTGLFAGSYPAFILSAFKPVSVLKGAFRTSQKGTNLRKGLVIFQFSLSIALIASTVVVYHQLGFMLNKEMGFDKEQQLILDFNWDGAVLGNAGAIKNELLSLAEVSSISLSRTVPSSHFPAAGTDIETIEGNMENFTPYIYEVDNNFIQHYKIEMVAGRAFSPDFQTDSISSLVINEAAVKAFGYNEPNKIIGKKFQQWGREGTIIGVVKDFNYMSLHQKVAPLTLRQVPYGRYFSLRISSNNYQEVLSKIEQKWSELAPHRPFLYSFLDESFNAQYIADIRFRKLFTIFSCLAIFIACLGLFGLATYSAMLRTKEIGIRKVLGAEILTIVALLSKDFIKLVGIAILIAIPFSWYGMEQWLNDYAYKIDVEWWVFLLSGIIALFIAILTVSFQALKSARRNPVKSLRTE